MLKKTTFVCIDCETTGLDPVKDKIIEVGAVRFTFEGTLSEFEGLIDPCCPLPPESIAIHHITQEMVTGKPKIEEVLPSILEVIGDYPIIGHGVSFDIDCLDNAAKACRLPCQIKKNRTIDTLRLARLYGDSPSNSLEYLAKHFNVPIIETHRAMADVLLNIAVFWHLVAKYNRVEEVFKVLEKPIKMRFMPLGKYKGRSFNELPLDYLKWASRLDFDQDLTFSIQQELKLRKNGGQFRQSTNPFANL